MEKAYLTFYTRPGRSLTRLVLTSERTKFDERAPAQHHDYKLDSSLSRTKAIAKELRFCNNWDYFATLTINSEKIDRYSWKECCKRLSKFFDHFKSRYAPDFRYLLVPEAHWDGAIHCHRLLAGLPDYYINNKGERVTILEIPDLVEKRFPDYIDEHGRKIGGYLAMVPNTKKYKRWLKYRDSFGHCSLDKIRDQDRCSSYILKYITKAIQCEYDGQLFLQPGDRILRASKGLNRCKKVDFDVDIKNTGFYYDLVEYLGKPIITDFCDIFQDLTPVQLDYVVGLLERYGFI